MQEPLDKDYVRGTLKLLVRTLPDSAEVPNRYADEFDRILTELKKSGFQIAPFVMPRSAASADRFRAHLIACIHYLKKAKPKAA